MDRWPHDVKLDLGCGNRKADGHFGVDIEKFDEVDAVYDLTQFPYPADNDSIDLITTRHTLEHFDWETVVKILNECHRILKPEHEMDIIVPLFPSDSAIDDPAHRTFFGKESWGRFEPENEFAYEMGIHNKWRRTINNWTPEISINETSEGVVWLFPNRRELHTILKKI